MRIGEIREMDSEKIASALDEAREELFKLRFQLANGQLTDVSQLRAGRRKIARLMTVLRERELAAQLLGEASAAAGEDEA